MQKNEDSDLLPLTTPFPKWMKETIPKWDKKLRITETGNAIFPPTKKALETTTEAQCGNQIALWFLG